MVPCSIECGVITSVRSVPTVHVVKYPTLACTDIYPSLDSGFDVKAFRTTPYGS